jgi:DUF4097 and DUF4098 domain-containing protein YvlB
MTSGRSQRNSIFAGALLVLLGLIFLLDRFNPLFGIGHLIRIYWPVLLILWGVTKLVDHLAPRGGQMRPPILSGGEALLLVLVAFILAGFVFRDALRERFPDFGVSMPGFHESYSRKQDLPPSTLPAGAHVTIDTARGDIAIRASEGNELRVSANQTAWAPMRSSADDRMNDVQVIIEHSGNDYRIHPLHQDDYHDAVNVDLNVQLPKTAVVWATTGHGDIDASGISGIDARTGHGNVNIQDAAGDVNVEMQGGDARITRLTGNLHVSGRGNDLEIEQVGGNATIEGTFIGSIDAQRVQQSVRLISPWADISLEHLVGQMQVDHGDINVSNVAGAATIQTRDKDVTASGVAGKLVIANVHADIQVTYQKPPQADASITDDSGEVDFTLPAKSNFSISAVSRQGEIDSDFEDPSLLMAHQEDTGRLVGKFGAGGPNIVNTPNIAIATSYGTISLHKSQ